MCRGFRIDQRIVIYFNSSPLRSFGIKAIIDGNERKSVAFSAPIADPAPADATAARCSDAQACQVSARQVAGCCAVATNARSSTSFMGGTPVESFAGAAADRAGCGGIVEPLRRIGRLQLESMTPRGSIAPNASHLSAPGQIGAVVRPGELHGHRCNRSRCPSPWCASTSPVPRGPSACREAGIDPETPAR